MSENAKLFYTLSMLTITAKKRYSDIKAAGIVRVLKVIRSM